MLVLVTMMKLLMMMMVMVVLVVGGAPCIGQEPPDDPSERCRVRASQVPQPTCFQLESFKWGGEPVEFELVRFPNRLARQLGEKLIFQHRRETCQFQFSMVSGSGKPTSGQDDVGLEPTAKFFHLGTLTKLSWDPVLAYRQFFSPSSVSFAFFSSSVLILFSDPLLSQRQFSDEVEFTWIQQKYRSITYTSCDDSCIL